MREPDTGALSAESAPTVHGAEPAAAILHQPIAALHASESASPMHTTEPAAVTLREPVAAALHASESATRVHAGESIPAMRAAKPATERLSGESELYSDGSDHQHVHLHNTTIARHHSRGRRGARGRRARRCCARIHVHAVHVSDIHSDHDPYTGDRFAGDDPHAQHTADPYSADHPHVYAGNVHALYAVYAHALHAYSVHTADARVVSNDPSRRRGRIRRVLA